MSDRELLFNRHSFSNLLDGMSTQIEEKVHGETREYLLNVNEEEYVAHLISEFAIAAVLIDKEHIEVAQQFEKEIQVSDYGLPLTPKRNFLTFAIPFTGERELFFYQPSTFASDPPRAEITKTNEVHITLLDSGDPKSIRHELDRAIQKIEQYLIWQRANIDDWNQKLPDMIRSIFKARKQKLLKDCGVVESLGFPLRKRGGPTSYTVPIRKILAVSRPSASNAPYKAHPKISEENYQEVLTALRNMALVMERSPSAFEGIDEEALRMHFLVQLNGAFEGDATGETFNYDGKTDILLRRDGRNLFVAECKFWDGP